jgi:hypothetical protein
MIDEHEVREMLQRRANAVTTIVVDAPKAARRARRRLLANGAVAMLAAAAIAVATFTGVDAIRSATVPADRPTPSPSTTENGQAVGQPHSMLHGEVTFQVAPPWKVRTWDSLNGPTWTTLVGPYEGQTRVRVMADPLPIETRPCREGPAPADAEALARSIRSYPNLKTTTEPVTVRIAGIEALRMDVVAVTASDHCQALVLRPGLNSSGDDLDRGYRMRLYLLDLPEGFSARIMAIAIAAPEPGFEAVVEAAAPIVDSFQLHTG